MRRYRDQETSTAQRKQATKRPKQAVRADASAESLRRQHAMARPREATPAVMFGLQQVIGNQALQRLIDESTRREQARAESGEMDAETGATIQRERGRGRPLDRTTAAQMGPALGDDYSGVRVHTDARADSLNRAMSAKAFTFGNDVFFSKNSYRPENPSGRHLLAHELTHVSQQHATMGSSRQAPLRLGPTNDRLEQEAERASTRVLTPSPAATTVGGSSLSQHSGLSTAPASVQRLEAKKSQQSTVKTSKQDDRPNLSFSDDRTIAINSANKEVSELYATQAVINAANVRLQTAGSDFELNVEGGTHITDGAHNNRLLKVVPHIKAHETTNAKSGYETRFCTHVSMEVARLIFSNMIASYHSGELFKLGYVDRYTTGRLRSTPVTRLVDIVSQVTDAASSDMSIAMKKSENHEEAGKDFGKLAKDKLETAANALGINRHARTALVAEGYATFSTGKSSGTGAHAQDDDHAGVVAASLDLRNKVTLENYNRSTDISQLKLKLLDQVLNKNKDVINTKINLLKRQIDASDKELLAMREKRNASTQGQTKAKGSGKGSVNPKFASLLLKKKKELKQASGAIFKEIFVAAKEIELKTAGEEETAVKVAADAQPVKRWSFQMYGSTKGNRSANVEPEADSSTARLP